MIMSNVGIIRITIMDMVTMYPSIIITSLLDIMEEAMEFGIQTQMAATVAAVIKTTTMVVAPTIKNSRTSGGDNPMLTINDRPLLS